MMRSTRNIRLKQVWLLSVLVVVAFGPMAGLAEERKYSVITTNRVIANPTKQTFTCESAGVFISTEFDGARLNDLKETGPGQYAALIKPENSPINDAAWYAFKI